MRVFLIAAILATAFPVTAFATVRAGVDAWEKGDPARATDIWRALADKGDPDAAFNLGQAYRLGRGVPADSGAAKRWFERAARTGHVDAQVSLGLLLFDIGDRDSALTWLGRAAERGDPRAMLVTGTALFNGDSMKSDPVLGYAYVSRAAAQGLAPARATLADMDKVMPLAQRQKAIALARRLAGIAAPAKEAPKTPAPKIARAASPPRPKVALEAAKPTPRPKVAMAESKPMPKPREASPAAKPPVVVTGSGVWRIQLGAFGTRGAAQALYARLGQKLGGAQAYYIPVGTMTRLQTGPYSKADATAACARLKPQPCFTVAAR
ncbi:MAG: SPOR domain-containing protein [Sphingomicrobium sp.]